MTSVVSGTHKGSIIAICGNTVGQSIIGDAAAGTVGGARFVVMLR